MSPDYAFVFLDSLGLVHVMDARIAGFPEETEPESHRSFVVACGSFNLSLNSAKQLPGSF